MKIGSIVRIKSLSGVSKHLWGIIGIVIKINNNVSFDLKITLNDYTHYKIFVDKDMIEILEE